MRQPRLLQGLPPDEHRKLVERAKIRSYGVGEAVYQEGDPADSLHFVLDGRLAVSVTSADGRELTAAIIERDEVFGELALVVTEGIRHATVRALEPTETMVIYRRDFDHLRQRHRAFSDLLVDMLTVRVIRQSVQLEEALYLPVQTRILRRLVELARTYGGGREPAVIPLTQEDIAGLAGTARATVNRILRAERSRGTVSLEKRRITVLDMESLVQRARLVRGTVDVRLV
ncbi:MAG: Crp/Fnr family transcriptional regulator [Chloroflexi bacterium]|nr:MAG: Crp/Fnr family transcriptional regulator [Chloroflexota bacterium]